MKLNSSRPSGYKGRFGYKNIIAIPNIPIDFKTSARYLIFVLKAFLIISLVCLLSVGILKLFKQQVVETIMEQYNIYHIEKTRALIIHETQPIFYQLKYLDEKIDRTKGESINWANLKYFSRHPRMRIKR